MDSELGLEKSTLGLIAGVLAPHHSTFTITSQVVSARYGRMESLGPPDLELKATLLAIFCQISLAIPKFAIKIL